MEVQEPVLEMEGIKLCTHLKPDSFATTAPFATSKLLDRVVEYQKLTDSLLRLFIRGCYHSTERQAAAWAHVLERVARQRGTDDGHRTWVDLQAYPALLLLYGGGIAALAGDKYGTLAALMVGARLVIDDEPQPAARHLLATQVMTNNVGRKLPGMEESRTPVSDWLCGFLRNVFQDVLTDSLAYDRYFDRFEYILALVHAHLSGPDCWVYGMGRYIRKRSTISFITNEAAAAGNEWPPLRAGLFDRNIETFRAVQERYDRWLHAVQ